LFPDGKSYFGTFDMSGNLWEWVADWQSPTYYEKSPEQDPKGPAASRFRVIRGGSWNDYEAKNLRAAVRPGFAPDGRHANIGFRCAKDGQ